MSDTPTITVGKSRPSTYGSRVQADWWMVFDGDRRYDGPIVSTDDLEPGTYALVPVPVACTCQPSRSGVHRGFCPVWAARVLGLETDNE